MNIKVSVCITTSFESLSTDKVNLLKEFPYNCNAYDISKSTIIIETVLFVLVIILLIIFLVYTWRNTWSRLEKCRNKNPNLHQKCYTSLQKPNFPGMRFLNSMICLFSYLISLLHFVGYRSIVFRHAGEGGNCCIT